MSIFLEFLKISNIHFTQSRPVVCCSIFYGTEVRPLTTKDPFNQCRTNGSCKSIYHWRQSIVVTIDIPAYLFDNTTLRHDRRDVVKTSEISSTISYFLFWSFHYESIFLANFAENISNNKLLSKKIIIF